MSYHQSSNEAASSDSRNLSKILEAMTSELMAKKGSISNMSSHQSSTGAVSSDFSEKKETLKAMNSEVHALIQRVKSLEKRLSDFTALNQGVKSLEKSFTDHTRFQNIVFAIEHSHIGSFSYYDYGRVYDSKDLVQKILLHLRQGRRFQLPRAALHDCVIRSEKEFHIKLVEQIHALTGTKPTIELDPGQQYFIYFP